MKAMKDLWLSLTVVFCFLAIIPVPVCVGSWLAAARWTREPAESPQSRRIRIDLRVPATLFAFGATTLAWYSYRRYKSSLRNAE